jgi:hypothetical protein
VADGSIFGLNIIPTITNTTQEENAEEEECTHRHKRTRRETFPIENLPEEIVSLLFIL